MGIGPSCSIVRYEMQRRASRTCGATIACVGQTSMQRVQVPQWSDTGSSAGSARSTNSSPRKYIEPPSRDSSSVCLPRQPRPARCASSTLHHRRRIGEDAMAERTDGVGDAVGQFLQASTHDLVIVAAVRVARHVGPARIVQHGPRRVDPVVVGRGGQVVHAHRDHRDGARHQLGRARAAHAVARHILHRPVVAPVEPVAQAALGLARSRIRRIVARQRVAVRHVGEAQLARPGPDRSRQVRGIDLDRGGEGEALHGAPIV